MILAESQIDQPGPHWSTYLIASIPGFLALGAVALGKLFDWRSSRRSTEDQNASKKEPTWSELVTENRALRTELTALDTKFDEVRKALGEMRGEMESLKIEQKLADRREALLYRHTKALRDHIINELPPPPPTAPTELIDWFRQFDETDTGTLYAR